MDKKYLVGIIASISDILRTPLGSRVMRPEYGSRLFELIDKRVNDEFRAKLAWYVTEAVEKWEPRVKIDGVKLKSFDGHKFHIQISLKSGEEIEVEV